MTHGTHKHTHKTPHSTHADMSGVNFTCTLSGEGSIVIIYLFIFTQTEGLVHLPSVFYSGCQNGEEETEQDM